MKRYTCVLMYRTPGGRAVQVSYQTEAATHVDAIVVAERLLRTDKRRLIDRIQYRKAIQHA